MALLSPQAQKQVKRRRTFAIISHPDAGKTTLTEKLLLFGGAIQMAGAVKGRKAGRHATSDWMEVEKQRGISVTSSVMQFEYNDHVINLLDTPGHEDFSEDTYRVLTAVDCAVMVIDAAKGVEAQTIKLLEVCRMRKTPIITFINKLDREVQDPIDLLGEIENVLKIDCAPITWPVGMGKTFRGVFSLLDNRMKRFTPGGEKLSMSSSRWKWIMFAKASNSFKVPVNRSLLNASWKVLKHRCSSAPVSTISVLRMC